MKELLEKIQKDKNITGRELAKMLMCSTTFITLVKNGERKLNYKSLKNLLSCLQPSEKKEVISKWVEYNSEFDFKELELSEEEQKDIKNAITKKILKKN